jgi:hypothetical protein
MPSRGLPATARLLGAYTHIGGLDVGTPLSTSIDESSTDAKAQRASCGVLDARQGRHSLD